MLALLCLGLYGFAMIDADIGIGKPMVQIANSRAVIRTMQNWVPSNQNLVLRRLEGLVLVLYLGRLLDSVLGHYCC